MKNIIKIFLIFAIITSMASAVYYPYKSTFPLSADISMNNHKLTDLAAPTASNDAATKAYVDSSGGSGGSGGVEVVTVGPSATNDYVTDGTNDYVEIQQALNDAVDGERVVEVQPADYNFGASGYIDIPNGIKITCPAEPAFGSSGYVSGSKQCAAFRITSTTTTPVIMRGGTVLENIYLVYPNQVDPNNVIVYPSTIIAATTIQEWDACPITIRGCVAGNAYKFIDFSTVDVLNDVLIEHVKGSVLHTGVKIDNCGHVTRCVDVQFVPEFGGVNSLAWQQYIGEHLVAFDCGVNLAGYFSECKVWPANTGYKLHDTWWTTMIDCMADLVTHPIILENTDRCRIIGGQFVAGTAADGGASITWSRSAHTAIFIDANSDSNVIDNVDVISGGSGVFISPGAFGNMITGCSFSVGLGQTDDWVGAIWDNGNKTISSLNAIEFGSRSGVQGIVTTGSDSEHSQFSYRDNGHGSSITFDVGTRTLLNGVGRNNGVPGSEGDWAGVAKPGAIVFDNTNQNAYICVDTAPGWNPVWKLIN
jgi:hypothetical protein